MITPARAEKATEDQVAEFAGRIDGSASPFEVPASIPAGDLRAILLAGLESPLGEQSRSWRFLVLREREQCNELLHAANVRTTAEPAAIIVVFALRGPWQRRAERLLAEAGRSREYAAAAVRSLPMAAWLETQARTALNAMSTATRALGWSAGILPRVDPVAVRRVLGLPGAVAVAGLLTVGGGRHLGAVEHVSPADVTTMPDYGFAAS